MILSEVNFFSETLTMRSTMHVLLPQYARAGKRRKQNYRTLYLLHGHSDDHSAWLRWSKIEKYVEGLNLAVVMPAANVSFYTDMVHGKNYLQFIGEEVPGVVRDMFPLSARREDNFVAGLSMGGYGAFKLALTHPERYAAAASLSGALDIVADIQKHAQAHDEDWLAEFRAIFGDLRKVRNSRHDLLALAQSVAKGKVRPRLYQCCGTEDFLYADNVRFHEAVRKLPLDLTYQEGPGEHNWAYWDATIQDVLAWMFSQGKKLSGLAGI